MRAGPRSQAAAPAAAAALERWSVDRAEADVARLDIPAHASRERRFEIFCSLAVAHPGDGVAHHALRVLVDGAQAWSRRVVTDPGGRDTLEIRLHRSVPVGRPLRLTAIAAFERARPLRLSISAEED